MTVKLTEIFGTRFFYVTWGKDLNYMFLTIGNIRNGSVTELPHAETEKLSEVFQAELNGQHVTIDIADAVIFRDVEGYFLTALRKGIDIIDSGNKARNNILSMNKERLATTVETVPLPALQKGKKIVEYVNALDASKVYELPAYDVSVYLRLVYIIACYRPEVKIILRANEGAFFKMVSNYLSVDDVKKYDSFYYIKKSGVYIVRLNVNKQFEDASEGMVTVEQAFQFGLLIPFALGQEKLTSKDSPFYPLFKVCLDIVSAYTEKTTTTIGEYFKVEEKS